MIRFFLKVFFLSFTAIAFSWFFEGAFYTFHYSRAGGEEGDGILITPEPAIVSRLLEDTTFLLLGMSGNPYPAPYLTDTIIVGKIIAKEGRILLVSIPRDFFIRVPGGSAMVKINALYELGKHFSPLAPELFIKEKVSEITGVSIDYYALIDIKGLEMLIDSFGGVDVEVKKPITNRLFPGPNYSYEPFSLETGAHHLNGHDAVRFARSRHAPMGDFERIERQQQLLKVLQEKFSLQNLSFETFIALLKNLEGHLFTNANLRDISSLLSFLMSSKKTTIDTYTFDTTSQGLLKSGKSQAGAFILLPKKGLENYSEIQEFFKSL